MEEWQKETEVQTITSRVELILYATFHAPLGEVTVSHFTTLSHAHALVHGEESSLNLLPRF